VYFDSVVMFVLPLGGRYLNCARQSAAEFLSTCHGHCRQWQAGW
jgi:hypothetical protein